MHRRLYYLFPDFNHTKQVVDELLLRRIDVQHIHVVARESVDHLGLPSATVFQRSDIRHSVVIGLLIGAVLGVGTGIMMHISWEMEFGGLMVATTITGAILGAWFASMVGLMTPNKELKPFIAKIDEGQLLLMVDVAKVEVEEIDQLIKSMHPEAKAQGVEPTLPSFP